MEGEPDDGHRLLITRFRPRALPKEKETWDEWSRHLGPSAPLLAAFQGKGVTPISLDEYKARYLAEMETQSERIAALASRVRAGENLTLLCSRDCILEQACHRTLLRALIEKAMAV